MSNDPVEMLDLDADEPSPGMDGGGADGYYGGMDENLRQVTKTAVWDTGYDGNVGAYRPRTTRHAECEICLTAVGALAYVVTTYDGNAAYAGAQGVSWRS